MARATQREWRRDYFRIADKSGSTPFLMDAARVSLLASDWKHQDGGCSIR
jgi:hypothetical protein